MDAPRGNDHRRPWNLPWLWIALATVVLGVVGVLAAYLPLILRCWREQRAIAEIDRLGGDYRVQRHGAPWPLTYLEKRTAYRSRYRQLFNRLKTVRLDGTRVTDAELAHLAGLTSLTELYLSGTQVTDAGLAHLAGLASVETLYLSGTQVTDAGLAHLASLTKLSHLNLSDTQITDAHLAGLTKLFWLNLSDTQVTDAGLSHLAGLANLIKLVLSGTQVTNIGVAALRSALPRVHISHGSGPAESKRWWVF